MKYYQSSEQPDGMIYRTDGNVVECALKKNMMFIESFFNVVRFCKAVEKGVFIECEKPEVHKPFYKNGDFWGNSVLIILLLIITIGSIFL